MTSESFFGPYKYDDTLKFARMVESLEKTSDNVCFERGQFDYELLRSQQEWQDHPIRQLVAKLNFTHSVPHWLDTVQAYHERQLSGATTRGSSSPSSRSRSNTPKRRIK